MSLDGVIDAPTWTFDNGFDPQMGEAIGAVTERSRGILLGRTTYEMFEPAWSTRTVEDDPGAPFFNDTTKYVVSGTLTAATWRNSKVIGPYDPDAIRGLKDEVDGDLYVSGSGTLVRAMLADGLVDELHLLVYPRRWRSRRWGELPGSGPRRSGADRVPCSVGQSLRPSSTACACSRCVWSTGRLAAASVRTLRLQPRSASIEASTMACLCPSTWRSANQRSKSTPPNCCTARSAHSWSGAGRSGIATWSLLATACACSSAAV